jgi:hypothetical protein
VVEAETVSKALYAPNVAVVNTSSTTNDTVALRTNELNDS